MIGPEDLPEPIGEGEAIARKAEADAQHHELQAARAASSQPWPRALGAVIFHQQVASLYREIARAARLADKHEVMS